MGDFAAGKLIDGVTFDPIALDTFEQYLNKHEMKSVFKGKNNGV